jgi:uncharacterized membrane protein
MERKLLYSAILGALALGSMTHSSTSLAANATDNTEKCYGIAKKGMNDCQTAHQSCAGSATEDKQPDAFLFVPQGLCNKIVGGQLTPPEKKPAE